MDIARSRELSRRCWDLFFFGFSGLGFGFEGFAVWGAKGFRVLGLQGFCSLGSWV